MNRIPIDKYFRLFVNCIPVMGATRSIICDLHRGNITFIPNDLFEIITECSNKTLAEIIDHYGEDNTETIISYFDLLEKNEYVFWLEKQQLHLFPELDRTFDYPAQVSNAIIDLNATSKYELSKVFDELEDLGCRHIQIRCFDAFSLNEVESICRKLNNRRFQSLDLLISYSDELTVSSVERLMHEYGRITRLTIHSSPADETPVRALKKVLFIQEKISDSSHCGYIDPGYFTVNIPAFTESVQYNSCLNRKISVDVNGEIRNCPATQPSFGNISDTSLHSALAYKNFKDLWNVNKDQIQVCRDCEFRHVCTDCRAFISKPNDIYAKPSKCNYNPYTAEWSGSQKMETAI